MQWATTQYWRPPCKNITILQNVIFLERTAKLHNHTSWFLLSERNTVVNISESACVSVPRNKVCKNPSISKLAITVSHSPRKKAAPISPWPHRQCCSFVLCNTFQLNYYFWYWSSSTEAFKYYIITNKAQFSLVKTNLYRIEKVQNKSRCMYCRLPLGNKKMKRDIINSESKMTRKCKCPIKLTITNLFI